MWGNALQITTNDSWNSLAIGRTPLLMSQLSKQISYYRKNPLPYYRTKCLTIYKETPYYGMNIFPYYRRKSLTNKEHVQGNTLL